jgi:hypothetical protein
MIDTPPLKELLVEKEVGGITMQIFYSLEPHVFSVVVSDGKETKMETFRANFEPVFGMDVLDSNMAYEIAEKLAKVLDNDKT